MNLHTDSFDFDESKFTLLPRYFDNRSLVHGINHTYRVMYHCLELGELTHCLKASLLAFMAAFIHDMARQHDGYCTEHGLWAATQKLPLFLGLFLESGATEGDLKLIGTAVLQHSLPDDIPNSDPAWLVSALLKDADALDRIRLGENNLMPEYLRFHESHALIEPAKLLYYKCPFKPLASFGELLALVG
jgi:hypothetical protein